jgi:two-component system, NarL family, nitrate/nitrite response regulator NarL
VLDLSFPSGDGLTAAAEILAASPGTKVLLLSAVMNAEVVRHGIQIGVQGFLSKAAGLAEILAALDRLGSGQVAIDAELFRSALSPAPRTARGPVDDPLGELTAREREVLDCIVDGADTAQIARRLGITASTARAHVQNVLMKLGVHTRLQAVAYVVAHGRPRTR